MQLRLPIFFQDMIFLQSYDNYCRAPTVLFLQYLLMALCHSKIHKRSCCVLQVSLCFVTPFKGLERSIFATSGRARYRTLCCFETFSVAIFKCAPAVPEAELPERTRHLWRSKCVSCQWLQWTSAIYCSFYTCDWQRCHQQERLFGQTLRFSLQGGGCWMQLWRALKCNILNLHFLVRTTVFCLYFRIVGWLPVLCQDKHLFPLF